MHAVTYEGVLGLQITPAATSALVSNSFVEFGQSAPYCY